MTSEADRTETAPAAAAVETEPPKPGARDLLLSQLIEWFGVNGVGDTSLRSLATAVGTSHRMLNYHFGSREGLLAAVVEVTRQRQQRLLDELVGDQEPYAAGWRFWSQLADGVDGFAPLFFELSAAAMQGRSWAGPVRDWTIDWVERTTAFFVAAGQSPERSRLLGQAAMAITRGALFDLALTGDRVSVDAVMADFLGSALQASHGSAGG